MNRFSRDTTAHRVAVAARRLIWPGCRARRFLTALLLLFALKQILIVLIFPPFSGHDEVAHFDYIRSVTNEHRLPIIPELDQWRTALAEGETPPGDYLAADLYPYCLFALEWPCYPSDPAFLNDPPYQMTGETDGQLYPTGWQYTANHPPLYYILAAPVYWVGERLGLGLGLQLRMLRLLAIPFGLLAIVATFWLSRILLPGRAMVPLTAATFVAFQPQLSFEAAIVNNDITVVATGALLLALLALGLRDGFNRRGLALIGGVLGVSLLFKGTALIFLPAIAFAIVARCGARNVRGWVTSGGLVAAIGFAIALPWYLFLYRTYGNLDALDQVARLQAAWNYPNGAPSFLGLLTDGGFLRRFGREAWGGFGWRRIPLGSGLLWMIGLFVALCAAGALVFLVREEGVRRCQRWQQQGLAMLLLTATIGYLAVIQFGTRFELAQARYFFPAAPALIVLLMLGWETITPVCLRRYAQVAFVGASIGLTLYIYCALVIPYWYMGLPR